MKNSDERLDPEALEARPTNGSMQCPTDVLALKFSK
jgi:hypothetical protein